MISEFYKKYIKWRPQYYKRLLAYRRHFKDYRRILERKEVMPCVLEFKCGYKVSILDKEGYSIFDEIFIRECHPLPYSQDSKIIIDIGANIGFFSIYAFLKTPKARVFAIEANPFTFKVLKNNIESNNLSDNIPLFNFAISENTGEANFFCNKIPGLSTLYVQESNEEVECVSVSTIKFSTFCKTNSLKYIDYLKMDIEGAEYAAILGDSSFFDIPIKEIIIEVHKSLGDNKYTFNQLIEHLKTRYSIVRILTSAWPECPLIHCRKLKEKFINNRAVSNLKQNVHLEKRKERG